MWGLTILGYHEVIILGMKAEYKSMALCLEGSVMGELFVNEIWEAYILEGSFSGGVGGRRGLLSELYPWYDTNILWSLKRTGYPIDEIDNG